MTSALTRYAHHCGFTMFLVVLILFIVYLLSFLLAAALIFCCLFHSSASCREKICPLFLFSVYFHNPCIRFQKRRPCETKSVLLESLSNEQGVSTLFTFGKHDSSSLSLLQKLNNKMKEPHSPLQQMLRPMPQDDLGVPNLPKRID